MTVLDYVWPFTSPDEPVRVGALVASVVTLTLLARALRSEPAVRWLLRAAPFAAALLSFGYVHFYLRGGPRIIDATAYFLEARTLASGAFAFPLSGPDTASLGRFLVRTSLAGQPAASVIFPPGYPAVLALGFVVGAPLLVGPALAFGLTLVTGALARLLHRSVTAASRAELSRGLASSVSEDQLALVASLFSVVCAALRYHTADTMSHGWAALCFGTALVLGARALDGASTGGPTLLAAAVAGLASGWLFATRPPSSLALAVTLLVAAAGWLPGKLTARALGAFALGALPPVALYLGYQDAATGSLTGNAQLSYYAASDGPAECFRYGFGTGIGCLGEHGSFVAANLPGGYDALAALKTTLRRAVQHLSDVHGFAPLFPLVVAGALVPVRAARMLGLAVLALVLAYAPFYFDGNFPGGGARMFADVLPLEHALAALGAARVAASHSARRVSLDAPRTGGLAVALSLFGFAVSTGAEHAQLRDRDGGRPMFEPRLAPRETLLFVGTDHGFNLAAAYAPGAVARHHGDALDRLAWEARGRPPALLYQYESGATLAPLAFDPSPTDLLPLVIEGESLWPPLRQDGAWAWPSYDVPECSSSRRALLLRASGSASGGAVTLRLPAEPLRGRQLTPRLTASVETGPRAYFVELIADGFETRAWHGELSPGRGCEALAPATIPSSAEALELRFGGVGGVALDALAFSETR